MKKIFLVIITILLVGCTNSKDKEINEIIAGNNYIILDVRTPDEYNQSHIKDAINIPYDSIDENIELDKSKKIMVYCKSGKRSNIAYNTLTNLGYDVYDMGAFESIKLDKE